MQEYKRIEDSWMVFSELMLPSHSNFSGKIHGGYILSLLDQIAFACASKHSENYCVTASVDTVDFLNPIEVGELVTLKASVNYVGNSSMVIGIRVEAENIRSKYVKHCNSSYFTMVAKDEEGKNISVPGLILGNIDEVRRFIRCQKRIQLIKNHTNFEESKFKIRDFIDELETAKVRLDFDWNTTT